MGGGCWTPQSFRDYSTSVGRSVNTDGTIKGNYSAQEMFTRRSLVMELNPKNVTRECVDNAEHPYTKPVILALDVTGSMGRAAVEVAKKINTVMTELYSKVSDIEFMIMGIGDLAYDDAPLQVSQFESDIRIAEQLDKVYFEHGGGGNGYESYSAAWYFGLYHTKLDCWNRGQKGIIITMGDEPLNPYLPGDTLGKVLGAPSEDVNTDSLYKQVCEKFDVFHIAIDGPSSYHYYTRQIKDSWGKLLGDNFSVCKPEELPQIITAIVNQCTYIGSDTGIVVNENGEVSW